LQYDGWIKLHRRLIEHPIMALAPCVYKTFGTILLMANYQPAKWYDGVAEVDIPRGSFITSGSALCQVLFISRQQLRDSISHLTRMGMITTNTRTNRYTMVNVCNYDTYQCIETTENQQENHERTTKEPRRNHGGTTTKEIKKERREEENTLFGADAPEKTADPFKAAAQAIWEIWLPKRRPTALVIEKYLRSRVVEHKGDPIADLEFLVKNAKVYNESEGEFAKGADVWFGAKGYCWSPIVLNGNGHGQHNGRSKREQEDAEIIQELLQEESQGW
jgi:hypothetical protein